MKIVLLCCFILPAFILPQSVNIITDIDDLKSAINSASPGDTILVKNGRYNSEGSITITNSGTAENPIVIKAEEIGGVELTGETYFDFRQCQFIVVEGFEFTSRDVTVIKLQACNNIRITRNRFALQETTSLKWVLVGGIWNDPNALSHHNRIDHNLFENKVQTGNFITIDGTPDPTYISSQYDRIDHNHFRNNSPRAVNEKESIRVGWSELSQSSGYTVIEYNLFEDCDGDPEIISVKTCGDTVRNNTFIRCAGTVSLRHGNRSSVYNNFFLGEGESGTGGIRIYGDDHLIYNNYFEGLTGTRWDAPITLTNGDYDGGSNLSRHFRINRAVIVHNTLINNSHSIEIGFTNNGKYSKPPRDVIIANNLVVSEENEITKLYSEPINLTWENNLFWPTGNSAIGADLDTNAYWTSDPLLIKDSYFKQTTNSPTIDAGNSNYSFLITDIEGQRRDDKLDIGADEFSLDAIYFEPLTQDDVGPKSNNNVTSVDWETDNLSNNFLLNQNYPNPFNPITTISYYIPRNCKVNISVFDILGNKVKVLLDETQYSGEHQVRFDGSNLSSGVYYYLLRTEESVLTNKMLLLK